MRKDIKDLPKAIEDAILIGKSIAASEIHYTLQHRSPFWTGTFNRSWKVQKGSLWPLRNLGKVILKHKQAVEFPRRRIDTH